MLSPNLRNICPLNSQRKRGRHSRGFARAASELCKFAGALLSRQTVPAGRAFRPKRCQRGPIVRGRSESNRCIIFVAELSKAHLCGSHVLLRKNNHTYPLRQSARPTLVPNLPIRARRKRPQKEDKQLSALACASVRLCACVPPPTRACVSQGRLCVAVQSLHCKPCATVRLQCSTVATWDEPRAKSQELRPKRKEAAANSQQSQLANWTLSRLGTWPVWRASLLCALSTVQQVRPASADCGPQCLPFFSHSSLCATLRK